MGLSLYMHGQLRSTALFIRYFLALQLNPQFPIILSFMIYNISSTLSTWHLQVVAIKLNSAHLLDSISDQQCVARAKSCPSTTATQSQKDMNLYSNDPSEAARGDVQAGKKVKDYLMIVCV